MTFRIRSVTQASLTTADGGSTQNFTAAGFGTPTCWIVTVSRTGDGAVLGSGAGRWNGVATDNVWSGAAGVDADTSGVYASDTDAQFEAQALNVDGPTVATEVLEAVGTLTTDGITLTYTTKPSVAFSVRVDLIFCTAAHIDNFNTTTNAYTGAPFQPNAAIFFYNGFSAQPGSNYRPNVGFAAFDGSTTTQCCVMSSSSGSVAPTTMRQQVDSTHALGFINAVGTKSSWLLTFQADGFTLVDDEGTGNMVVGFLLIQDAESDFWCGALATPTSTGTTNYPDPGFGAGGGWFVTTFANALDATVSSATTPVGSSGFGVWTGEEEGCASASVQGGVDPSNTASLVSTSQSFLALDDTGVTALAGTTSTSGGFQVTYTTVDGSARYFLALVFSAVDGYEAVAEVVSIVESVDLNLGSAVDEVLSIAEEVVTYAMDALPGEADVFGEGGFPAVVIGEAGYPRMVAGDG